MSKSDHWKKFCENYSRLRAPLRPDAATMQLIARISGDRTVAAALLGVTPDYADLSDNLTAFDSSPAMLAMIWPGDTDKRRAIKADWTRLPLPNRSIGLIFADGSFNTFVTLAATESLFLECRRILAADGLVIARLFTRAASEMDPADVLSFARSRQCSNFHALKWMMAGALSKPEDFSVSVQSIRNAFLTTFNSTAELASVCGLDPMETDTLEAYAGSDAVFNFPTRAAFAAMAEKTGFRLHFVEAPAHDLSEKCPLAVLSLPD